MVKVVVLPLGSKLSVMINFSCWEVCLISADYQIQETSGIGNVVIVILSLVILLLLLLLL